MTGARWLLATVMVCATVCALALGVYDLAVRQPRTPRLAVVDIAKLFAAAERAAKESLLTPASTAADPQAQPGTGDAARTAELLAAARAVENFGPSVEKVLSDISGECRCAIVAMAAVVGGNATVPDYTQEAARRLGVSLRVSRADVSPAGR